MINYEHNSETRLGDKIEMITSHRHNATKTYMQKKILSKPLVCPTCMHPKMVA